MQTVVKDAPVLMTLLGAPALEQPVVVFDEKAAKRDIQRANEVGTALERRFDLVFHGKGKHVDNFPSVKLAKSVRVGNGSTGHLVDSFVRRALFVATPASLALITAFGAAAASDIAILLAGVVPLTWVPAAAIRSMRADRAAKVDIERSAQLRASEDDIAAIESFVTKLKADASPLSLAVARQVVAAWIETGTDEHVLTTTGVNRLAALLDSFPIPTPEDAAAATRLRETHALVTDLGARKPTKKDVPALQAMLANLNDLERDALAARWRATLTTDPNERNQLRDDLRALLPDGKKSDVAVEPSIPVVFAPVEST